MEEKEKKGSPKWIWILVVIIVALVGAGIWYFSKGSSDSSDTASTSDTKVAAVIPDGWLGFTSSKYSFSLSYPSDYTIAEGPTGTIKLSKGATEMVDLYVTSAEGDSGGMMTSQENLFTDETKGYMIMDETIQTKAAGITATRVNGKFGKNAGISQTHEGITGSALFFIQDEKLFVFDSYDNADPIAMDNFDKIIGSLSF